MSKEVGLPRNPCLEAQTLKKTTNKQTCRYKMN